MKPASYCRIETVQVVKLNFFELVIVNGIDNESSLQYYNGMYL